MKKLVALLMIASFLSANTTAAFAEQNVNERGRVSGRVERERGQSERRPVINRSAPDRRPIINRPDSDRRAVINRPAPDRRHIVNRPDPDRRHIVTRPNRPIYNDNYRYNRPAPRHNSNFFGRSGYYSHRPAPQYRPRPFPYYAHHHNVRRSSSITPLEFLGIGAAIIAIAAAASHTCNDY